MIFVFVALKFTLKMYMDTYTFIHIPKNAGFAIKSYIHNNNLDIKTDKSTHENVKRINNKDHHTELCETNNNPIIIIRDPLERFKSLYYYWKYGNMSQKKKKPKDTNITSFIDIFKMSEEQRVNIYDNHFWDVHLKKQTFWINNVDYKNITVIKYNDNIINSFNKLLDNRFISGNMSRLYVNITNYGDDDYNLSSDHLQFLKEYYHDDFVLYETVEKQPELFKKVIT